MRMHLKMSLLFVGALVLTMGACKKSSPTAAVAAGVDWTMHGRTNDEQRFSPLSQINEQNIGQLGLLWVRFWFSHLPPAGTAFFRGAGLGGRNLAVGFSRPRMAVASRLICPTNSGFTQRSTKTWWTLSPRPFVGKFRKGPRKGGLGGDIDPPHKTADAPEDRRSPQSLNGGPGVGVVIDRLAHKGPGQGLALPRLPAESLRRADRQLSRFGATPRC